MNRDRLAWPVVAVPDGYSAQVLAYRDLASDVPRPDDDAAVFLCGPRGSAEVFLGPHRLGRAATSPVDVLESLDVRLGGERSARVQVLPDHVEKHHSLDGDVTAHSRWFVTVDHPCVVVWLSAGNASKERRRIEVSVQTRYNVNYVSKFRRYADDLHQLSAERLTVRDTRFPAVHAVTGCRPAWQQVTVSPTTAAGELGSPDAVLASWTVGLELDPGAEASLVIAVAGSDTAGAADTAVTAVLRDPEAAFAAMITHWEHRTASGACLDTGRGTVDRLFSHAKLWAHKDARMVPLGAPYAPGTRGTEVLALTASPDYHGVFANDNAQSCWELGALGPDFYPVLEHTLDLLAGHGIPESVEIDPIDATGLPWLSPLRIGQRPQWVMGATGLALWSGRHAERYWPTVRTVLDGFAGDDADGDWLDDYSSSTFPEQPDPGVFSHEMLYASAFWCQAFRMGSELALLVGDHDQAEAWTRSAHRVASAVERAFGAPYGYASWLDVEHRQHPHRGHTMVLPLQYEMASAERASAAFDALLHGPLWSPDGPLAMEPASADPGGAHAWGFMRWNLVDAMFRYGRVDEAADLLERWATQEEGLLFQAPEGFPTVTGVTGKGYVWTAARSLRAILFGLCGLRLRAAGLGVVPRLPTGWGEVHLTGLPFRGATYDITIARGSVAELVVDGVALPPDALLSTDGSPDRHQVLVRVAS